MSIPVFGKSPGPSEPTDKGEEPLSMTKSAFESLGIVMENGKPTPKFRLNEPAFLPGTSSMKSNYNCDDDDTSFVVLGKSSMDFINAASLADYEQIQKQSLVIDYNSIISTLSHEEVEKKVVELLRENEKLKATLLQNNNTMKNHFMTLSTYQEELSKVHGSHKKKFAETREEIIRLRKENEQLRNKVVMVESTMNSRFSGEMIGESLLQKPRSTIVPSSLEREGQLEASSDSINSQASSGSSKTSAIIQNDMTAVEDPSSILKTKRSHQDRHIHYQEEIIWSLKEQIRVLTANLCPPLQQNLEITGSLESDNNHKGFLENFTYYNEKLSAVAKCYAAQTNRFTEIQDCLKRCIDVLDNYEHIEPADLTLDTRIMHKKTLDECRHQLIEEQLKNISERQSLIKAQNHFAKIFSDYNSVLHELEILREENSKPVERKPSMDLGKLDILRERRQLEEAKVAFETERLSFEQEKESLNEERASLNSQSLLYEAQMKSLQDDARESEKRHKEMLTEVTKTREEIQKKDIELEGIRARLALAREDREQIELLNDHLKIYKNDYDEEKEARQVLLREREHLTDQLGKLRDYNQQLLQRINGPNPTTLRAGRQNVSGDGTPIDEFCDVCGLYKMPGSWHGLGYCQLPD